tara:strand:+ start:2160 stop:2741 length:582 start_codon:yes stop_codon:yes gene_type:complete
MNSNINFLKKEQRKFAIKKRLEINKIINLDNNFFYKRIIQIEWFKKSKVIASFLSIKTEISTKNINNFIQISGKILCLPIINENNDGTLVFKSYSNKDELIIGKFGIEVPLNTDTVLPDIIFVPCLAFDINGFRLGYGGGFYDKSIAYFKSIKHNFITVGLAYDDQKVDKVIHDDYDQKLDYILSEKQLYKVL